MSEALAAALKAVELNDLASVKRALPSPGPLLQTRGEGNQSVVLLAVYYGRQQILEHLLSLQPKLDLFEACAVGDLARANALLDGGLEAIDSFANDGWTPLRLAAFFGRGPVVELLLDCGANPLAVSLNSTSNHALHAAVVRGHTQIAELPLQKGADVNAVEKNGWTPLLLAASRGDLDLASTPLRHGARPDAQNGEGRAALDLAREKGFDAIVALLSEQEAERSL